MTAVSAPARPRRRGSLLLALTVSLACAAAALLAAEWPALRELEVRTLDWRFQIRGPQPPPDQVAVLAIDDRTLAALGRFPLPRAVLADTVDRLQKAGARSVGIDLLLLEHEPPYDGLVMSAGDRRLHGALIRAGNAVLAVALLFGPEARLTPAAQVLLAEHAFPLVEQPPSGALPLPRAEGALVPLAPFAQVAAIGHVNLLLDPGGQPRTLHPAIAVDGVVLPAFHVELARRQLELPRGELGLSLRGTLRLGERRVPLDSDLGQPLLFYGPTGTVPTHSLLDLLQDRLPPERLAGRAVLLGATALGVGDTFGTPFASALPGVEVLATGVANLVAGETLQRTPLSRWIDAGLALVLGLAAWALGWLPGPRLLALGATLLLLAAWLAGLQIVFVAANLWLGATLPTLALVLSAALVAAARSSQERLARREAERQRRNLARWVSPVMAEQLATEELPSFDQREQPAAILFVDLSGFTGESELRTPGETARFLKEYHALIEQVSLAHGGVVEQFVGDGAMIIFGLPQPRDDDPLRAYACARALLLAIATWRPGAQGRAGLHYGPVVMARLGGEAQGQVAAAGDTVNVASRLLSVAGGHGALLALSGAALEAARRAGGEDLAQGFIELRGQQLRGRRGTLTVWIADGSQLGLAGPAARGAG